MLIFRGPVQIGTVTPVPPYVSNRTLFSIARLPTIHEHNSKISKTNYYINSQTMYNSFRELDRSNEYEVCKKEIGHSTGPSLKNKQNHYSTFSSTQNVLEHEMCPIDQGPSTRAISIAIGLLHVS